MEFGGIPFTVKDGVVQLSGAMIRGDKEVRIGVKNRFVRLYVLHGCGWLERNGKRIGSYVLVYEDGTSFDLPIVYGRHVRDWWHTEGENLSEGKLAWVGYNRIKSSIGIYLSSYRNPYPEKMVKEIIYRKEKGVLGPFLLAMSLR